jgi:hypothetical protein
MIARIGFQDVGQAWQSNSTVHNPLDVVFSNEEACHTEITLVVFMRHQSERAVLQRALCHEFRPAQSLHKEQDPLSPHCVKQQGLSCTRTFPFASPFPSQFLSHAGVRGPATMRGAPANSPGQGYIHVCIMTTMRGFPATGPEKVFIRV